MSLVLRWLHVLAAITWIGGMLFLALVLVPVTRREEPALSARLFHAVGVRFRTIGWIALGLLAATGLGNLWLNPYLWALPRFRWKLGLVVLALVFAVVHDFVLGPRSGAPAAAPSVRVRASWLARINIVVVLVIVLLGLSLFR